MLVTHANILSSINSQASNRWAIFCNITASFYLFIGLIPIVNFTNILWAAFTTFSFCQKSQNVSTESCAKHFCTNKLLVKCWWNYYLDWISSKLSRMAMCSIAINFFTFFVKSEYGNIFVISSFNEWTSKTENARIWTHLNSAKRWFVWKIRKYILSLLSELTFVNYFVLDNRFKIRGSIVHLKWKRILILNNS